MALSKEFLQLEIEKADITIKKLEEGLDINILVKKAFEDELSKLE